MSTPEEAAAILNDLSPGTAEQIAKRIIERHEAGQRRSNGSMALHPNHEHWYIADAYRLARIVLSQPSVAGLQAALALAGDEIIAARRKISALEAELDEGATA